MIDTHTNNPAVVKIKEAVNELIRVDAQFEKMKQWHNENHKDVLIGIMNEATVAGDLTDEELSPFINHIYWNTKEAASDIAVIFYIDDKRMRSIIKPIKINIKCTSCSCPITVRSRNQIAEARRHHRGSGAVCDECAYRGHSAISPLNVTPKPHLEPVSVPKSRNPVEKSVPFSDEKREQIQHLRSMPYKEYLQTDHWKEVRSRALKHAGYACQLCNSQGKLHVHHRTYIRRGHEHPRDVIALCADCHHHFHYRMNEPEEDTA